MLKITKDTKQNNHDKYSKLVEYEQICLTYDQFPKLALLGITAPVILCVLFWNSVDQNYAVALTLISIFPLVLFPLYCGYLFKKAKPKIGEIQNWGKLLSLVYFLRSCIWAAPSVVFFVSNSLANQFTLLFMLSVVAVFNIISTAGYKPVFYSTIIILMLPITIRSLFDFTGFSIAYSVFILVLTLLFILFYRKLNQTFQNSIITGHEKTNLANELEKANLDKSRFLAAASHDLRQPLHAQGLYIAELKKIISDPKASKIITSLENSTNAMRTMFDTLLDISKLDAGVIKPDIQHFKLNTIFNELMLDFSGMALDKDLSFRIVDTAIIIKSDPILLSRIIRNFVLNAIKYTNKGGILLGCRRKNDNSVSIEILDTGIGITPDEQDKIFQEFLQLNNTERDRNKGLGLGLAIVKRLALLLNHPIMLQSQLHQGSNFSIVVPIGNEDKINLFEKTFPTKYNSDLIKLSVLIIDDDTAILEAMKWLLEDWGCTVHTAESEQEAINKIDTISNPPEIIIADYRLRENKTGVEAIKLINNRFKTEIPGIIITGDTSPTRIEEAESSGYKVLHKPLAPDKIRSLLSYYKNTKQLNNPIVELEEN
ncbi:Signal transduction histidine kinase [hydrothermal vent metagenome]|uniref:histidine kinase n=1 Tax=hydrothermal vent metagenome TaxID=652676 RepID=A0A3B1A7B3_9ZZZZ